MGKSKYTNFDLKAMREGLAASAEKGDDNSKISSDTWNPKLEKGQSEAEYLIRFLPNPDAVFDEKRNMTVPFVQRNTHMIKFPTTKEYIHEPCPQRAKKGKCPICEHIAPFYDSGNPHEKKINSEQYAKPRYMCNVYIISDPRNDGVNEGKIMIFEYGKKIHDKCIDILTDPDEPNAYFDPINGATFKMKVVKTAENNGESFPNYDNSKFVKVGQPLVLKDGTVINEKNIDAFMEKAFPLNEKYLGDSSFKSYDQLKEIYANQGYKGGKVDTDNLPPAPNHSKKVAEEDLPFDRTPTSSGVKAAVKKDVVESRNPAPAQKVTAEKEKEDEDYSADINKDADEDLRSLLDDDDK